MVIAAWRSLILSRDRSSKTSSCRAIPKASTSIRKAIGLMNVPDAHQVAAVDLRSRKQVSSWGTPGLGSNFPMALADAGGPLAVVFRRPARLALLNPATGAVTASLETGGDAHDVYFDGKHARSYVSCGDGTVDVVQRSTDEVRQTERVATSSDARTSIFVPKIDRLFVAARAQDAWIRGRHSRLPPIP
jgi:hypothetical protein